MNAKEGMRRVGVVLGVFGAIVGGAVGYSDLQTVWRSHTRFERLEAAAIIHHLDGDIKSYQDWQKAWQRAMADPNLNQQFPNGSSESGTLTVDQFAERIKKHYPELRALPNAVITERIITRYPELRRLVPSAPAPFDFAALGAKLILSPREAGASDRIADSAAEITVDVNENNPDGIVSVNADRSGRISSIRLTTGEWIHREPQTFTAYLALIARLLVPPLSFLAIGFLVPYGAMRVAVWVGSGFFEPRGSA